VNFFEVQLVQMIDRREQLLCTAAIPVERWSLRLPAAPVADDEK